MALEKSRFFDSIGDDRIYQSEEFAEFFRMFLSDGIRNGGTTLMVKQTGSGMSVNVSYGMALVQGYGYWLENDGSGIKTLDIQASGSTPRIDRIVLRLDRSLSERTVRLAVKKGSPAAQPAAPALTRTNNIYELSLAAVTVRANTLKIETGDIKDERWGTSTCGLINSLIGLDASEFQARAEEILDQLANQGYIPLDQATTVATANKLLKLNASAKLPASITGDADTVDGKHAADFATATQGTKADNAIPKTGGALTSGTISGVPDPSGSTHVANKHYVDAGLQTKANLSDYNILAGIGTTLPDKTDLNTVLDSGIYLINGSYTYYHCPVPWGLLVVQSVAGGFRSQTVLQRDKMLIRMHANSAWSDFKEPNLTPTNASITLLNGWTASTQYGTPRGSVIAGVVHLRGQAYAGNNYSIGTLPAALRPVGEDLLIGCAAVSSDGVVQPVTLQILRGGAIKILTNLNVSLLYRINFSGVCYPII